MISVEFEAEIFRAQSRGGISRYLSELISTFLHTPNLDVAPNRSRWATSNKHALEAGLGWEPPGVRSMHPRVRRLLYGLGNTVTDLGRAADLTHATFYAGRGPRASTKPLVTTVHDMAPERLPAMFATNPHPSKRAYVERSHVIICVSEFSRAELLDLWGPIEARTAVVYHGVRRPTSAPRQIHDRDSMVLYVGDRRAYKDFDVVLEAFSHLPRTTFAKLIAAGGGPFNFDERRAIERRKLCSRVFQVQPDDRDLWDLYARAAAFVFPSRYEGFGMPTLEAMVAGCPAVLSNTSSLHEVGGGAALYFEAGDSAGLRDLLLRLAADRSLAEDLQARGFRRASYFTWRRAARETAAVYRSVLYGDPRSPNAALRSS